MMADTGADVTILSKAKWPRDWELGPLEAQSLASRELSIL